MDDRLTALLGRALDPAATAPGLPLFHAGRWLADDAEPVARVAAAFLVTLPGPHHPDHARARTILAEPPAGTDEIVAFYERGFERIERELRTAFGDDPAVAARWDASHRGARRGHLRGRGGRGHVAALFPQAVGIRHHENAQVSALRHARTVEIDALAARPHRRTLRVRCSSPPTCC